MDVERLDELGLKPLQAMGVTPPATVQVRDIAALKSVNKMLATRPAEDVRTLLPGLQHHGELTLTENTADLGGITLAHAALQRHLAGNPPPRIDGLTTDQRCFVAWAQWWAYMARPERVRQLAATDYHANSALRGYAPLLHLHAFHKAFDTRPGDPMWREPGDRVTIW